MSDVLEKTGKFALGLMYQERYQEQIQFQIDEIDHLVKFQRIQ